MIPNFAIESMVQKHVATLAENNVEGWDEEGELRLEWVERQEYALPARYLLCEYAQALT